LNLPLRTFEQTTDWLDNQGYPELLGGHNILITNIPKALKKKRLVFDKHTKEIMFKDGFGDVTKGYIYKYRYGINFDGIFSLPKKHILKCETINKIISQDLFEDYIFVSTPLVDVKDNWPPYQVYENNRLDVCTHCHKEMDNLIEQMQKQCKKELQKQSSVLSKHNIYKYVFEWNFLSNQYRHKKNYTCEKCGISGPPVSRKFIQIHHIDNDQSNNKGGNLQCLCTLCHFDVDDKHRNKMQNDPLLKEFIQKHQPVIQHNPISNKSLDIFKSMQ